MKSPETEMFTGQKLLQEVVLDDEFNHSFDEVELFSDQKLKEDSTIEVKNKI